MPYSVLTKDGIQINNIPDNIPRDSDEIRQRVEEARENRPQPMEEVAGVGEALVGGTKSFLSTIGTGLTAPFITGEEATTRGRAREEKITERPGYSLENVKRAYKEDGLLSATGEVVSQVPSAIAGQSPILASIYGGFQLAKYIPGPAGVAAKIIAPMLPIFFSMAGSNMQRKAEEDIAQGKDVDINEVGAYATSFAQTSLERVGLALSGVARLLGLSSLKQGGTEVVERLARESLSKAIGKGTARFAIAEIPTEVSQQVLERYYAGLSLTDEDAQKEYVETAFAVSLMAPIGSFTGYMQRRDAKAIADPVDKDGEIKNKEDKDEAGKSEKEKTKNIKEAIKAEEKRKDLLNINLDPKKMPTGGFTEEETAAIEAQKILDKEAADKEREIIETQTAGLDVAGPEVAGFDEVAFRKQLKANTTEMSAEEQKSYTDTGVLPESYVQRKVDEEKKRVVIPEEVIPEVVIPEVTGPTVGEKSTFFLPDGTTEEAEVLRISPDGKIIIVRDKDTGKESIVNYAKYSTTNPLDPSFKIEGFQIEEGVSSFRVDSVTDAQLDVLITRQEAKVKATAKAKNMPNKPTFIRELNALKAERDRRAKIKVETKPKVETKEEKAAAKKKEKEEKDLKKLKLKLVKQEAIENKYNIDTPTKIKDRTKVRIYEFDSERVIETEEKIDKKEQEVKQKISQEVKSLAEDAKTEVPQFLKTGAVVYSPLEESPFDRAKSTDEFIENTIKDYILEESMDTKTPASDEKETTEGKDAKGKNIVVTSQEQRDRRAKIRKEFYDSPILDNYLEKIGETKESIDSRVKKFKVPTRWVDPSTEEKRYKAAEKKRKAQEDAIEVERLIKDEGMLREDAKAKVKEDRKAQDARDKAEEKRKEKEAKAAAKKAKEEAEAKLNANSAVISRKDNKAYIKQAEKEKKDAIALYNRQTQQVKKEINEAKKRTGEEVSAAEKAEIERRIRDRRAGIDTQDFGNDFDYDNFRLKKVNFISNSEAKRILEQSPNAEVGIENINRLLDKMIRVAENPRAPLIDVETNRPFTIKQRNEYERDLKFQKRLLLKLMQSPIMKDIKLNVVSERRMRDIEQKRADLRNEDVSALPRTKVALGEYIEVSKGQEIGLKGNNIFVLDKLTSIETIRTFTHEVSHAGTVYGMRFIEIKEALELTEILDKARRVAREQGVTEFKGDFYGLTNLAELAAESLSNNKFSDFLRKTPSVRPGQTSLLDDILNFIRKLLGFDQVIPVSEYSLLDDIMTQNKTFSTFGAMPTDDAQLAIDIKKMKAIQAANLLKEGKSEEIINALLDPNERLALEAKDDSETTTPDPTRRTTEERQASMKAGMLESPGVISRVWTALKKFFVEKDAETIAALHQRFIDIGQPLRVFQQHMEDSNMKIVGKEGYNNSYDWATVMHGLADTHMKALLPIMRDYEQSILKYSELYKQENPDKDDLDARAYAQDLLTAQHETERREVLFMLRAPLSNDKLISYTKEDGTLVKTSPAAHREDIMTEVTGGKTKLSKSELDGYKKKLLELVDPANKFLDGSKKGVRYADDTKGGAVNISDSLYDVSNLNYDEGIQMRNELNALKTTNPQLYKALTNIQKNMNKIQRGQVKNKDYPDGVKGILELNQLANFSPIQAMNVIDLYGWDYYIPLKGKAAKKDVDKYLEAVLDPVGGGAMSTKLKTLPATMEGGQKDAADPFAQVIVDASQAAARAGRIGFTTALHNQITVKHEVPDAPKVINKETGKETVATVSLIEGKVVGEFNYQQRHKNESEIETLLKRRNTFVHFKKDGTLVILSVADDRMLLAIRGLPREDKPLIDWMGSVTSMIGQLHTRYSIKFTPLNFARDAITNLYLVGTDMGLVLPEFDFEPITSKVKGSLCVPIVLDTQEVYNIYVAKNNIRRYNFDSLPPFILIKILVAKELSTNPRFKSIHSIPSKNELFTCPKDGNESISWKLSDSIYVIVLDEDELTQLKGTTVDTRKESQRESQKNP
mgnify:CR=1 FL=1